MAERETATIRTILVDDERLAVDELSYLLKDFPKSRSSARLITVRKRSN